MTADFQATQTKFTQDIRADETNSVVPVFVLSTHNGANTVEEDAEKKIAALHKGGLRKFEFLLRGDENILKLDDYIDQVLAAIDKLAVKYPDAQFGVGTVSSPERMKRIAENKNVGFIVMAHWNEEMVKIAIDHGKPIIPTVSGTDELEVDDQFAKPGSKGTNTLVPARIHALREMGGETIKIFDFGAICAERLKDTTISKPDDTQKVAAGMVAVAEAIHDSFNGEPIPADKDFYAMATGGLDKHTTSLLLANIQKNPNLKKAIREITGSTQKADQIIGLLERTYFIAGGTFLTKKYDDATPGNEAAYLNTGKLQQLASDTLDAATKALETGMVSSVKIGG